MVGRADEADLRISGEQVSRQHLVIRPTEQGWLLEDVSRNGSFVDGRRITRVDLDRPLLVTLGTGRDAPALRFQPVDPDAVGGPDGTRPDTAAVRSARQGKLSSVHRIPGATIRVGRAPDNDVVLGDDLLVSRHHAVLTRREDRWRVQDLGSPNGTFLNGRRVTDAILGGEDVLGIGHFLLHLDGDHLVEYVDTGDVAFRAEGLVVTVPGGKRILDGVGFSLPSRSLLAVVGPSGAGKSTLLRALTGFRPADQGRVEYAGRDLYADYDELRQRIGLVPQDDILHKELTVRRAMSYAAQLRFPAGVTAKERNRRIEQVTDELGLGEQRRQRITSLSGGQRKRTSVALELLTRPSLLFLDEPTSGLDPGLDKSVMQTLRRLADDGRTVVVVTHSVANLDVCDRLLLLAPGGSVAYFGPPLEALEYFGVADFAEVFLLLESQTGPQWATRFRDSAQGSRYLEAAKIKPTSPESPSEVHATAHRQQSTAAQLGILCRRYCSVIAADRQYLLFMAALPLVLSALAHALPSERGLSLRAPLTGATSGSPNSLLLVFVIGAALMGSAASIRELVKEREIYRRERAIGLSRAAYLWSKIVVLSVIVGSQAVLLGWLGNLDNPPPDEAVLLGSGSAEIVVALVGVALASMTVGLLISALIDNADRGMPLLVLLAMLQFILSSAVLQIGESPVMGQLSWLIPARWGFAMGASTIGLDGKPPYQPDPLWAATSGTWLFDLAMLVVLTAGFAAGVAVLLRRLDPRRRV